MLSAYKGNFCHVRYTKEKYVLRLAGDTWGKEWPRVWWMLKVVWRKKGPMKTHDVSCCFLSLCLSVCQFICLSRCLSVCHSSYLNILSRFCAGSVFLADLQPLWSYALSSDNLFSMQIIPFIRLAASNVPIRDRLIYGHQKHMQV